MRKYLPKDFFRKPSPPTSLPYKVRTAGFIESSPHHATLGTYNDDAMITLFIDGKGYYSSSKEKFEILPGMLGLVLPDEEIGILFSDKDDPYEHYYCRFAGSEALKTARIIRKKMQKPFAQMEDWVNITEIFEKLLSYFKKFRPSDSPAASERISPADASLALLLSLLENCNKAQEEKLSRDDLVRYINERISYPVDLDKMSLYFNLSKEHLCRSGKKLLGETLYNYWYKAKMRWAMRLLEETDEKISEISLKCGYKDPFYFSRAFKAFSGKSPKHWRRVSKLHGLKSRSVFQGFPERFKIRIRKFMV